MFYTIQGEGVFAGYPAVFIRLAGCNLQCSFCDTEFEEFNSLEVSKIVDFVKTHLSSGLVVITGGEPFLQPISYLCNALLKSGFDVQIETNGTIWRPLNKKVSIVCSPKIGKRNDVYIDKRFFDRATIFKFLISAGDDRYSDIPKYYLDNINVKKAPIYIQPMDEYNVLKNKKNVELVKRLSLERGYRVSLQLHKIIDIE